MDESAQTTNPAPIANERDLLLAYRLWVIRLGIALAWIALFAILWSGYRSRGAGDDIVLATAIGFGAGLAVVSMLPLSLIHI